MHLILEDAREPEDLFQRGIFFAFRQLLLERHQLFSFIGILIRLIELLGPLCHHLLPEIRHLLFGLQLSGQSGIIILLLKEGGWHHVGKEPQKEGQSEFCKRHHQEEGEGNQLQAVTGGPDQQAPLAHGERVALEDTLRQEIRGAHVGSEEFEPGVHPLQEVLHGITEIFTPLDDDHGVLDKCPTKDSHFAYKPTEGVDGLMPELDQHLLSLLSIARQGPRGRLRRLRQRRHRALRGFCRAAGAGAVGDAAALWVETSKTLPQGAQKGAIGGQESSQLFGD
mmetsp:Transcript_55445/g.121349  ORF Transcript_55445/g.121349 Transcript_55445/m.121349 type:complete len:281 (+) Transcript_55445:1089-1931(+)